MHKSKLNYLIRKAKSSRYDNFDSVRVENFGKYLVFRVGNYSKYRDARHDVADIRTTTRDAYVKRCNLIRKNILFIKNEYNEEPFQKLIYEKVQVQKKIKRHKKIAKKRYVKKKELTYTYKRSGSSLWEDCKKCFIPVYEEGNDSSYQPDIKPKHKQEQIQPRRGIRIEVPKPKINKELFWQEDKKIKIIKRVTKRKKRKNKFNIDEQFLP